MAEDVQTGGLMRFRYGKDSSSKLDDDRKREIREAYALADERKAREKRNRIIFWVLMLIALIILGGLGFLFLK